MQLKKPLPPPTFMRKGYGGQINSGFMTKYPAILRGATLQLHPAMGIPPPRKNTLERA